MRGNLQKRQRQVIKPQLS